MKQQELKDNVQNHLQTRLAPEGQIKVPQNIYFVFVSHIEWYMRQVGRQKFPLPGTKFKVRLSQQYKKTQGNLVKLNPHLWEN